VRLKVGELSKRSGLSVRTLHHYDSVGLLKPSVRSDAGYRLYGEADIQRLNNILALRELGIALDEIRQILEGGMRSTPEVLSAQLTHVDAEISRQQTLRAELDRLQRAMLEKDEPSEAACLRTLEAMAFYRRHLSEEDRSLPLLGSNGRFAAAWQEPVDGLRELFEKGVSPRASVARHAARNWIALVEKDTKSNAGMFVRVDNLLTLRGADLSNTGFSPQLGEYILSAFCEHRLLIYRKYLAPSAYKHLRCTYIGVMREWPRLLDGLDALRKARRSPTNAEVQRMARLWIDMRRKLALDDAAIQAMRHAEESEEELRVGTWFHPRLLAFLKEAVASVAASANDQAPNT
jgi:DNA-binding transcriptional MerR regulator